MPKIEFSGFLVEKENNDKKSIKIMLDNYIEPVNKFISDLFNFQNKKGELKLLDITIEYHYKKRTLDQNKLMWVLYQLWANELNCNINGGSEITAQSLYIDDLYSFAPQAQIVIKKEMLDYYNSNYYILGKEQFVGENKILLTLVETSSHFNTLQMAKWIDRIFNQISEMGISERNQHIILAHWQKWRKYLNDERIQFIDSLLTTNEYRKLTPICEATGRYLGTGGHIAHINATGMGGGNAELDYSWNLLHLSAEAHLGIQHAKGWGEFIKKYPHLKNKIESAHSRGFLK